MSIFKNANESAFVGGRKHWTDVIKNSGAPGLLLWKQPEEDFNTNSTLIVNPGEQAIFIKDGRVEQVFDNGSYKLSTENYPFISRLRNMFSGGISTFNCFVYFVRKSDTEEIKWGTDSPIQLRDKVYNIRTTARVRGAYRLRIEDPATFLSKMVSSNVESFSNDDLTRYFSMEFQGKIKSAVSKLLDSLQRELIGIEQYMDELNDAIKPYVDEALQDYGMKCVRFTLGGLDIDESKYDQIDQAQISALQKIKEAQGDKGAMDILGADWARLQSAGILKDLANNPGAGGIGAVGAGMGMGAAAGSVFGSMASQMFGSFNSGMQQGSVQQPQPAPGPSGRFSAGPAPVQQPAGQPAQGQEDPMATLQKLKQMLDMGLITQEAYDAKAKEVLSRM